MYFPGAVILGLVTASMATAIDFHITVDEVSKTETHATGHCYWSGTSPFCAGSCPSNYEECRTDSCGDGACCVTGYKKYCCQGGCPSRLSDMKPSGDVVSEGDEAHKPGGPHDDYCPVGTSICCPLHARKNSECLCLDDESAEVVRSPQPSLQSTLGDPDNDLCKPNERICCDPDARKNKQCRCYKP